MSKYKPKSQTRQIREKIVRSTYGTTKTVGDMIKQARISLGLSRAYVAYRMGVAEVTWHKYEYDKLVVPSHILIKLFMFGFDFFYPYPLRFTDLETPPVVGEYIPKKTNNKTQPPQPPRHNADA